MPIPSEHYIDIGAGRRLYIRSVGDGTLSLEVNDGMSGVTVPLTPQQGLDVIQAAAQAIGDAIAP